MPNRVKGIIADIKKFETHDGPGIRTTVFLKGCYLNCRWCANPETKEPYPQLYFIPRRCTGCGRCVKVCPENALTMDLKNKVDRKKCIMCFKCVEACVNFAFKQVGREMTVEEVVTEVEKDKPFYGADGGLTVSGGEPLCQPEFTRQLMKEVKERNISTVLDTSGYASWEVVESILEYTDLVLLDIKHMDPVKHKEGTGVANQLILQNARLMVKKRPVRISLPLIPGYNDSKDNIEKTADFARSIGVEWVDIMPLHKFGQSKYEFLGLESPYEQYGQLSAEEVIYVRDIFRSRGLKTTIGRMM